MRTVQRRLTYTSNRKYPGCSGVVRSSFNGNRIAYLGKDKNGIQQIFTISPLGGEPTQVTEHDSDVQSGVRWCQVNSFFAYIWDKSIIVCETSDRPFLKRLRRLTSRTDDTPLNIVWSPVGKTIACNCLVLNGGTNDQIKQIFIINLDTNK
jgi:hypothetical protein